MTPDKSLDTEHLSKWIGKSETVRDLIHPTQARLLQATFDTTPFLKAGDNLPPLWHWAYCLQGVPLSDLGRDGHPALGGFMPPVALPRRMWAGGRLTFKAPLILGQTVTKTSTIASVSLKQGKSGPLCFVTVRHTWTDEDNAELLVEEQDIVYREDPAVDSPAPKTVDAPEGSIASQTITPSEVQLFRYSALTFNSHRIHYDRSYCQEVEGYSGLVVHGPLIATLLAGFAEQQCGATLKSFDFRAVSPLIDTDDFSIHTDGNSAVWAVNKHGGLAMKANFSLK